METPALALPSPQGPRPHMGAGKRGACLGGCIFLWRRVSVLTMWVIMTTRVTGAYREETMQLCLQAEWADMQWECGGTQGGLLWGLSAEGRSGGAG